MKKYTKADLEKIVLTQLENLEVVHDLLRILKHQNELIDTLNRKLDKKISGEPLKTYPIPGRKRKSPVR